MLHNFGYATYMLCNYFDVLFVFFFYRAGVFRANSGSRVRSYSYGYQSFVD